MKAHVILRRLGLVFAAVVLLAGLSVSGALADGGADDADDNGNNGGGGALPGRAFITINVNTCPVGYVGETAVDYSQNCGMNPAEAATLTITPGLTDVTPSLLTTDVNGKIDVQVSPVERKYDVAVPLPAGIQGYLVFCVEAGQSGSGFTYGFSQVGFHLTGIQPDDAIICDLLYIPVGTPPATNVQVLSSAPTTTAPTETGLAVSDTAIATGVAVTALPATGAGAVGMGALAVAGTGLAGLLVAGASIAAGAALAFRKRSALSR